MAELEQYCILAKAQKGRACAALVQQVLNHKRIFVFGELLSIPSVQSLAESEFNKEYNSLALFAYGSYADYTAHPHDYIEMSEQQLAKLRQLTLLSLAAKHSFLAYSSLQTALGLQSTRELEDLLVETIYAGLLEGKLDQKEQQLRVFRVASRDVQPSTFPALLRHLNAWKATTEALTLAVQQNNSFLSEQKRQGELNQKKLQAAADERKSAVREQLEMDNDMIDSEEMDSFPPARKPREMFGFSSSMR